MVSLLSSMGKIIEFFFTSNEFLLLKKEVLGKESFALLLCSTVNYPHELHNSSSSHGYYKHGYQSRVRAAGYGVDALLCAVDGSRIISKWA
jgi:hypothetical protein